jgi:hypothetical protein
VRPIPTFPADAAQFRALDGADTGCIAMTPTEAVRRLRRPATIRQRCAMVFAAAERGATRHLGLDLARLEACAGYVAETIRAGHPSLAVPYHSRWRHFAEGGIDRWKPIAARFTGRAAIERVRAAIDLAVVSVLLDAGAGAGWHYREPSTGRVIGRSEGLAVASLDMFAGGLFSTDADDPFRVDAEALAALDAGALARGFQAGDANPMVGLEGRAGLLRRLGAALAARPDLFGAPPRPSGLADALARAAPGGALPAAAILEALLDGLGPIWPARVVLDGVNLGDVGRHPAAASGDATDGLVPFHKLSQWLAYSLFEPFEWLGLAIAEPDALTGLPEYRNGGLFVDAGVIVPRHEGVTREAHDAASEPVVEWRALTVVLLDRIAPLVRARLGVDAAAFPLARVLEGGPWAAGRRIAREKRADGAPPIAVVSDGTIF